MLACKGSRAKDQVSSFVCIIYFTHSAEPGRSMVGLDEDDFGNDDDDDDDDDEIDENDPQLLVGLFWV